MKRPGTLDIIYCKFKYPELYKLLTGFNLTKKNDILLLGDSVAERISKTDYDTRTLAEMLKALYEPDKELLPISHSAYNMRMFDAYFNFFSILKHKPEFVIIPINIRSFSPQWYYEPEYQFINEIEIINRILGSHIKSDDKVKTEFPETEVQFPLIDFNKIKQFKNVIENKCEEDTYKSYRKRIIFIYHYTNQIYPTHSLLGSLSNILESAERFEIKVFFYFTPINYQAGLEYVGEDFLKIIHSNLNIIQEIIYRNPHMGVYCKNYLEYLPKEDFFNIDCATEHLNQVGRKKLAEAIYGNINDIMKKNPDN